jgi:chaperonin cofactor prefoldin
MKPTAEVVKKRRAWYGVMRDLENRVPTLEKRVETLETLVELLAHNLDRLLKKERVR